jgi:hypothetical protein
MGLLTVGIQTRREDDLLLALSFVHASPPPLLLYHPLTESLPLF